MESLPQEMLVEIFRRADPESRVAVFNTSQTFRSAVRNLIVPVTSVLVLEKLCEEGDLLSLYQSQYEPSHYSEAFYCACVNRHWGAVNWFLNKGFKDWQLCLLAACESGNRKLVDHCLIKLGFKKERANDEVGPYRTVAFDINSSTLNCAMGSAARGGHRDLVDLLMSYGGLGWGEVLVGAAYSGDFRLFNLARQMGSVMSTRAMEAACTKGNIVIVRWLLDLGGYVSHGFPSACEHGHEEIVELLFSHWPNRCSLPEGLESACRGRQHGIVKLLIEKGASDWESGLRGACEGADLELIEIMLQNGATNLTDGFHAAVRRGHFDVARLMWQRGAVPDWNLVLKYAVRYENQNWIKMAFDHGATDLNSAFNEACCFDIKLMMRMLIERGATECECELPLEDHL